MRHLETNKLVGLARSDDFANKLTKIFEENKRKQQSIKKLGSKITFQTLKRFVKAEQNTKGLRNRAALLGFFMRLS